MARRRRFFADILSSLPARSGRAPGCGGTEPILGAMQHDRAVASSAQERLEHTVSDFLLSTAINLTPLAPIEIRSGARLRLEILTTQETERRTLTVYARTGSDTAQWRWQAAAIRFHVLCLRQSPPQPTNIPAEPLQSVGTSTGACATSLRAKRARGTAARSASVVAAMGNALSWIVSQLFGDKEARILILGLDNGTRNQSSVLQCCALRLPLLATDIGCCVRGRRFHACNSRSCGVCDYATACRFLFAAGKTSILYRLKEGTFHSTVPSTLRPRSMHVCCR